MADKICEHCKPTILAYLDAEFDLRSRLRLLAHLMLAINPAAEFDHENVSSAGYEVEHYLDRLQILHHYFLNAELVESIEDALLQSELVRLNAKFPNKGSD